MLARLAEDLSFVRKRLPEISFVLGFLFPFCALVFPLDSRTCF